MSPMTDETKKRLRRIRRLLKLKVPKAEIARQEGISRQRLYELLEEDEKRSK
jgi:DNA invertase Pin-like site-specific DNA recombinase